MYKEDLLELLSCVSDDADIGVFVNGRCVLDVFAIKDLTGLPQGETTNNEGCFDAALIAMDGWDYGDCYTV